MAFLHRHTHDPSLVRAAMENTASSSQQAETDGPRRSGRKTEKPSRYKDAAAECPAVERKAMKKASVKAKTAPDLPLAALEAVAQAVDGSRTEPQHAQQVARLDALIATMQAAAEQHGPREALVRTSMRHRMRGMALSDADKADVEACAVAADAHSEAASGVRTLTAQLEAEHKLCVQRTEGLAELHRAIDPLQDEVMRAPVHLKEGVRGKLKEMLHDAAELQLRECEAQIYCEVTEVKLYEAHAALAGARAAIQQLMASVPRALRQKGVAAALLGDGWAA